jgi:hypothetical protein
VIIEGAIDGCLRGDGPSIAIDKELDVAHSEPLFHLGSLPALGPFLELFSSQHMKSKLLVEPVSKINQDSAMGARLYLDSALPNQGPHYLVR